jgi:hypothetical protein
MAKQNLKQPNQKNNNMANPKSIVATYACPMHPDVKSDKDGKCPKCGMNLVQKKTK